MINDWRFISKTVYACPWENRTNRLSVASDKYRCINIIINTCFLHRPQRTHFAWNSYMKVYSTLWTFELELVTLVLRETCEAHTLLGTGTQLFIPSYVHLYTDKPVGDLRALFFWPMRAGAILPHWNMTTNHSIQNLGKTPYRQTPDKHRVHKL